MWWYKCFCMILVHPVDVGYLVKRKRDNIPWAVIILPLLLTAVLRIISVYTTNYTVASVFPRDASIMLEIGIVILPVLLWSVASYAFMTIMGGESTYKETLTMSSLALAPNIVLTPFVLLLSRALAFQEKSFYNFLQVMIFIWVVLLIFLSFKESNNLSLKRSLGFAFIVLIVMALLLTVCVLIFALISQIVLFVQEVLSEASYYLL